MPQKEKYKQTDSCQLCKELADIHYSEGKNYGRKNSLVQEKYSTIGIFWFSTQVKNYIIIKIIKEK